MIDSKLDIFENISLTDEGNYYYSFENTKKKDMCFYTAIDSSNGYNNFTLYLNDDYLEKTEDWEIICTESSNKENLELSYTNLEENQHLGTFAAYYDEETWKNTINNLKEQELNITEFKGNVIKGTVTSTKEKDILFTDHSHCHRCRRLDFTSEILGEKEILRRTVQKKNRDLKIGDK